MTPVTAALTPRPRLESTGVVYDLAEELAARLDGGGMDLWAANLRGCLDAPTTGERLEHLGLEVERLRHSPAARRLALEGDVARLQDVLAAALGAPDPVMAPLYAALRELVDRLRLEGLSGVITRLRRSGVGTSRSRDAAPAAELAPAHPTALVAELRSVLAALPERASAGAGRAAEAAAARLDRVPAQVAARALELAVRRPR